jgi:hypothetical protein
MGITGVEATGAVDNLSTPRDPSAVLHAEMLRLISAVEDALTKLSEAAPGIGHNRPPGSEQASLLDESELEQIKRDITLLKSTSAVVTPLIELHAVPCASQQPRQGCLAPFERLAAQIVAVEFDDVECQHEHAGIVTYRMRSNTAMPSSTTCDGLAIENAAARARRHSAH